MSRLLLAALLLPLFLGCGSSSNETLFKAIRNGEVREVERILAAGGVALDPPQQPYQVNKPLAYAAAYGNLEMVKLILGKGADINGQVAYGDVPLIKASEHGNMDILTFLVEQGADVNRPNAFGVTPFIGFCATADIEVVRLALKHGGQINESYEQHTKPNKGRKNFTALQASVKYGKTEVVKLLLQHGGVPSIKSSSGKTCLQIAQEEGHEEIVELLTLWKDRRHSE